MVPWMVGFAAAAAPHRLRAGTDALGSLLRRAWPAWRGEIAASGLGDLFVSRGSLHLFERVATLSVAEAEGRVLAGQGVAFEDLSASAARARVPGLAVQVAGGRYFPGNTHVRDPRAVVNRLADRFVADGGRIERQFVAGFDIAGGKVHAVRTPTGELEVGGVVVAAGADAGRLGRMLGAVTPLTRERGYHVMVASDDLPLDQPVACAERGFVLTPMSMGTRLAGTVELGGGEAPDWRRADILLTHASALFGKPSLAITDRWFGNRPTLPDYLPMIGPAPRAANAVLALGHQHLGLTLAAITGALVTELVQGTPPSLDIAAFAAGRFGQTG